MLGGNRGHSIEQVTLDRRANMTALAHRTHRMVAGPLQQGWRYLCVAFAPKRPVTFQARRIQIGLVFDQEVSVGRAFLELVDAHQ
ncbi:hypothetical protein ALP85_200141 [Pseudomonas syringae pv. syringae]|nr:hypothetical protein ALP85_200141 [Pseudomonas syringae pv. syringae]